MALFLFHTIVLYGILVLLSLLHRCVSVFPSYIPAIDEGPNVGRDDLVVRYFNLGLNNAEIVLFLSLGHGLIMSIRQLKRILRNLHLKRRSVQNNSDEIINALESELKSSGSSIGYRQMHHRLTMNHGLFINRETVRKALKLLDPDGVSCRSKHKLKRRMYRAKGPNFIWHIDGYDELKPFGFSIHGGIDGFSRRILWLEVGHTNKNPKVVAHYFVNCVQQVGGLPRIVRADAGTENVNVSGIQRFLRRDDEDSFGGEKSFMYGKSTSNQRIESWWSFLRKSFTGWWMEFFKKMREDGEYCDDNPVHIQCLSYCFMSLLKEELYCVAQNWNLHKIRPTRNPDSPSGRPDVLYFVPECVGVTDCKVIPNEDDVDISKELCEDEQSSLAVIFQELADMIMEDEDFAQPQNAHDAKVLYHQLLLCIDRL